MKPSLLPFLLALALTAVTARAVTIQSKIEPAEVNVGEEVTVTYTAQGGSIGDIQLPSVDGLTVEGTSSSSQFVMSGMSVSQTVSQSFSLLANRAGNFVIPAFGIHTPDGQIVRTQPLKLHVLGGGGNVSPAPSAPAASNAGPVVMPPAAPDVTAPQPSGGGADGTISVPTDADGRPARVFHLITPKTTDAYVGESIPLKIEFFIRMDSNAQQNSLPTLVGSDFLMNNLSLRPAQDGVGISGEEYIRDTWITAISAPKAGDFPLEATRDTYWTKSSPGFNDPFGGLFGRAPQLEHHEIGSNKVVIHVHSLPEEGQPANFTGAIGKFQVTGSALPGSVGVGEPVTLHFTVSGEGNFDYVRCPTLAPDPDWKSYVASSKVEYEDESHTQATKTFDQAVIPQKNGTLPLPPASFSYFDPDAKHYVTIPVALPSINVTGTMPVAIATPPPAETAATASATNSSPASYFAANQLALGTLTPDLSPGYAHPWFWIVQASLLVVVLLGLLFWIVRPRPDPTRAERAQRHATLRQEEDAMSHAVRENDAVKFFAAARHMVQLRLAERWQVPPEMLTLNEIYRRDEALGEIVAPLFTEADNVIYSGEARTGLDLTEWERHVREMFQPARL
jgi:hypothetical protein